MSKIHYNLAQRSYPRFSTQNPVLIHQDLIELPFSELPFMENTRKFSDVPLYLSSENITDYPEQTTATKV